MLQVNQRASDVPFLPRWMIAADDPSSSYVDWIFWFRPSIPPPVWHLYAGAPSTAPRISVCLVRPGSNLGYWIWDWAKSWKWQWQIKSNLEWGNSWSRLTRMLLLQFNKQRKSHASDCCGWTHWASLWMCRRNKTHFATKKPIVLFSPGSRISTAPLSQPPLGQLPIMKRPPAAPSVPTLAHRYGRSTAFKRMPDSIVCGEDWQLESAQREEEPQ